VTKNLHLATIFLQLVAKRRLEDFFNFEPCCLVSKGKGGRGNNIVERKFVESYSEETVVFICGKDKGHQLKLTRVGNMLDQQFETFLTEVLNYLKLLITIDSYQFCQLIIIDKLFFL